MSRRKDDEQKPSYTIEFRAEAVKPVHQLIAPHAWRLPFERAWRKQNVQGG